MKLKIITCWLLMIFTLKIASCHNNKSMNNLAEDNYIGALKDTLLQMAENSDNEFFKMHCNSMISVIDSKVSFTSADSNFLELTYNAFNNLSDTSNAKILSTYIKRQRPLIVAWTSPTDGAVSFSWLKPPKNWDPELEYPVYIQLHGLWSVASNSIEYMTHPFREGASTSKSFDDGYLLSPWGRGNYWYEGISETDIWECLEAIEQIVNVDPSRKYLSGHSMGGFGAWSIARKSPNTWAALGIHAGALWYNSSSLVNTTIANILKDLPTYFVCGTNDGLLGINQTAFNLLDDAGNENIEFVTFTGGHEYVEENVENMYLWMREFVNEDWNTDIIESLEITQNKPFIRCFPNPTRTTTNIVCSINENSAVIITVYDIYGRLVAEELNEQATSNEFTIPFYTKSLAEGIYFIRLKSGKEIVESKLVVIK